MKKTWLSLSLFLLLFIPLVAADTLNDKLAAVAGKIISLGQLGFLGLPSGPIVAALLRVLLWVLIFTIIFAVIDFFRDTRRGGDTFRFLTRPQAIVIAAIVATISAIFLPVEVLLATGAGIGTVVSLLLVGGPVLAVGYFLWTFPEDEPETRGTIFLKLVVCLILFWVLTVMYYHLQAIAPVAGGVVTV